MRKLQEVICISSGDSNLISTWSGIPYFHTKGLEESGIIVHRVDIGYSKFAVWLYDRTIRRFKKLFCRESKLDIYNSWLCYLRLTIQIMLAQMRWRTSDAIIVYAYLPFYHKASTRPTILLCDWSFQYHLYHRLSKSPDFFEKRYIRRENKTIKQSSLVFSLFENCADYMSQQSGRKVLSVEGNVINAVEEPDSEIIKRKVNRKRIVFIGRNHYLSGLLHLLNALDSVRGSFPDLELDVIGMTESVLPKECHTEGVHFYGYLRKDVPDECNHFYQILREASIIVNPNEGWAGFSSILEAMYFFTPVVTTPFDAFTKEFGESIRFGEYCTTANVADKITSILNSNNYIQMCQSAHDIVATFTWSNYIRRFLRLIETELS